MVDHFIEDPLVIAWLKSSDVVYAFIGINIWSSGGGRKEHGPECGGIAAVAVYKYFWHSTEGTVGIGGLGCYQMVPFLTEG